MRIIYLAFGWVAGIIVAANDRTGETASAWVVAVIFALLLVWKTRHHRSNRLHMAVMVAFALGGLRLALVPVTSPLAGYNNAAEYFRIAGMVAAEPDARDDRTWLRVEAHTIARGRELFPTDGLLLVEAPPNMPLRYGDFITASGRLTKPGLIDSFSYADYLARGGVFTIMYDARVQVLSHNNGAPLHAALLDLKAAAQAIIAQRLPEPSAALLTGILLGNARRIAPEVTDAFNATGASHIVAISGFNMAIVSGVVMGILKRFNVRRRWAAFMGISVVTVYTLLIGGNASAVRAAIMCSVLVIGGVIRRKTYVPASLAFVAMLMSALNPTILWDVGFQLSWFAVLGLTLFVEPFSKALNRVLERLFPRPAAQMLGGWLAEPLVVTLAAQVFALPLVILYFERLSLVALIVNLLIIPAQAPLMILGGAAVLVSAVAPALGQMLFWLDMLFLRWTIDVVRLFARLPSASVEFHVDPRLLVVFFGAIMGGALVRAAEPTWALALARLIRRRAVVMAVLAAGSAVLVLMFAVYRGYPNGRLHIWFLDMGRSNAALIQTPRGAHLLVDGGRFPSRLLTALGDRLPFNKQTLDAVIITQPDENDIGGLAAMVGRYQVGVLLTNRQPTLSRTYETLRTSLGDQRIVTVRAGYTLDADDGTRLEILHPQRLPRLRDSTDDQALVLRLSYGDVSFLLPGDLSRRGQQTLLRRGWPLGSTVLQLPRHAAANSLEETFLKAIAPQVAVLQADADAPYSQPHPDTLKLLGDTPLFRTDVGGTIHLWTDGKELWMGREG